MKCRLCQSVRSVVVIDLGQQTNGSVFPKNRDVQLNSCPLVLEKCEDCGLVQLKDTLDSKELYESGEYGYKSSINPMMINHITKLVKEIEEKYLKKNATSTQGALKPEVSTKTKVFLHHKIKNLLCHLHLYTRETR